MKEYLLTANHVCKRFAQHTALDDVSINVERGKIFGLLGPNGAGKTTLIRIINRITAPDSGEVVFSGHPLAPDDVFNIGYLPEERGLYKKMKVGEQAIYLAQLKGLSRREAKRRLTEWFERLGIMPWWDKKLEELSKGMAQKVQFVITVLHAPELLIFDEPFSGFDPLNADLLKHEILDLRDKGHTIIFSTHNMSSVEEICDDIALIHRSKVVLDGSVDEVRNRFRNGTFRLVVESGILQERPDLYTIEATETLRALTTYSLRATAGVSASRLMAAVADDVAVRSFAETMPSMHDIFVQTVSEANHE